jgi:hypothetical protein
VTRDTTLLLSPVPEPQTIDATPNFDAPGGMIPSRQRKSRAWITRAVLIAAIACETLALYAIPLPGIAG